MRFFIELRRTRLERDFTPGRDERSALRLNAGDFWRARTRLARHLAVVSVLAGLAVVADSVGAAVAAHRKPALAVRDRSARYLCAHASAPPSQCGSVFDWPLPRNPRVLDGSAAMIARLFSTGSGEVTPVQLNPAPGHDWGDALFYSNPSDPVYRIHCNKPAPESCPVEGWQIHIPALARPASGSDALMSVISKASDREFDFWDVQSVPLARHGGTIVVGWGGYSALDGWGTGASSSCGGGGSCTIMSKGLTTYSDLSSGHINHALYLLAGCSNGRNVYPAYSEGGGGACADTSNAPAYGQWLQLNMPDSQINRLRVPRWLKAIYRAFADYGAMFYDSGSSGAFDIQIESPQSYTALGLRNPFVGWASWQRLHARRSHVGAYVAAGGQRYWLDFGGGIDWASKLRVIDPCVIAGTC